MNALKMPQVGMTSRETRLENALREVVQQSSYALDEEEVVIFDFEVKNISMGIFIGVLICSMLIAVGISTDIIHCGLNIGHLLPF